MPQIATLFPNDTVLKNHYSADCDLFRLLLWRREQTVCRPSGERPPDVSISSLKVRKSRGTFGFRKSTPLRGSTAGFHRCMRRRELSTAGVRLDWRWPSLGLH